MRRSAAALGLTLIGLWLILTFKSSPASRLAINAVPPISTVPAGPANTSPAPGAAPPPGSNPTTTVGPTSGPRTITGGLFSNRYGDVQVAVVVSGNQIIDVKALKLPSDRARSRDISDQAAPLLHDEVIQAQSAQIDTIGGATYTSASYAQSLQSALDKVHG
ncbi:MAG: hypothetical protein QOF30_2942 [Acidimicrobiaceae bacterium]|jgi:hypothetical protein|nr:hypothetical protein [Acidimicrobiaceae bacterium]